jgi:hypothetical protein
MTGESDHVVAQALYSFTKQGEEEVSFSAGQQIILAPKGNDQCFSFSVVVVVVTLINVKSKTAEVFFNLFIHAYIRNMHSDILLLFFFQNCSPTCVGGC